VQVAAADPARQRLHEQLARAWHWLGDIVVDDELLAARIGRQPNGYTSPVALRRTAVVALLAGVLSASCAVPVPTARSAADYTKKATHTAEEVVSAVETTLLALEGASRDRAFVTTLAVIVTDAEDDARGAAGTFERVEPRGKGADAVRQELVPLLRQAVDGLADARIATRRGLTGPTTITPLERRLETSAEALADFVAAQP
jgi:hypothetical protein